MRSLGCVRWVASAVGGLALCLLVRPVTVSAACGDGHIDGNEQCDGTDLGGKTCLDVTSGFAQSGTLTCKADCTLDTTDCRRAFIASLIPSTAGPRKNHCQLEWGTVGTTSKGRPANRFCSEGDPTCDVDDQFNNSCTFRIQLCMNVPDGRITGCQPARIVRLDVMQPTLSTDAGKQVASAILAAAQRAAPDQAHISGGAVSFGPPITDFACGSSTFTVPLKGTTGSAKKGVVHIKARTSDNSGKVRSVGSITFTCMP